MTRIKCYEVHAEMELFGNISEALNILNEAKRISIIRNMLVTDPVATG